MKQLGDKIRELRERKNMTQTELSEILNMKTYTTVSKWEKNENFPKGKDLKKLAEIFNVTSDYLLGLADEEKEKYHNERNHEILTIFNQLEKDRQSNVIDYATSQLNEQVSTKTTTILDKYKNDDYIIDYVEGLVAAGRGIFQEDNLHMEVRLRVDDVPDNYDTIAKVAGDSMEPNFKNGEVVLIKETGFDYDGAVYAIDWDGQTYIKKVYREPDGLRLVSLNPKYKDRFAPYDEEPRIIGKIVGNFMPLGS